MQNNNDNPHPHQNYAYQPDEHQDALRRRFPRAGYWFGALPDHPLIPHVQPPVPIPRGMPARAPPHLVRHVPQVPAQPPLPVPPPQPYHPHDPLAHLLRMQPHQPVNVPAAPAPADAQVPQAQPSAPSAKSVSHIKVSIPRNTGVAGAIVSRVTIKLPVDIPFVDFFDRVCAQMDLHPNNTRIGYKYHTDRARDPPHQLSNEEELREAFDIGVGLTQRARSRVIVMEIHNLNPATHARKRKAVHDRAEDASDEPSTMLSFVKELRMLKEHLACAAHPGRYCRVSPINGQHINVDIFHLTLWAKKMFLKEATVHQPPEVLGFDHVMKKPRRGKSPSTPSLPAIHVHIPGVVPLGDVHGQHRVNSQAPSASMHESSSSSRGIIDLTRSPVGDRSVQYPSIGELLVDLDEKYPHLGALRFLPALLDSGRLYADTVNGLDIDRLMAEWQMPFDMAAHLSAAAQVAVEQARAQVRDPPEGPTTAPIPHAGSSRASSGPALPSIVSSPPLSPSPSPSPSQTSSAEAYEPEDM